MSFFFGSAFFRAFAPSLWIKLNEASSRTNIDLFRLFPNTKDPLSPILFLDMSNSIIECKLFERKCTPLGPIKLREMFNVRTDVDVANGRDMNPK